MDTKYLVVAAVMSVMLIGATALATEDSLASEKKQNSQATSQVNDCGNEILPENVGCQNTDKQLQGDNNSCTSNSLVADQVFPDERNDGEMQAFQNQGEPEVIEVDRIYDWVIC
jgi:hypothetical protein